MMQYKNYVTFSYTTKFIGYKPQTGHKTTGLDSMKPEKRGNHDETFLDNVLLQLKVWNRGKHLVSFSIQMVVLKRTVGLFG